MALELRLRVGSGRGDEVGMGRPLQAEETE